MNQQLLRFPHIFSRLGCTALSIFLAPVLLSPLAYADTLQQVISRTLQSNPDVAITAQTRLAVEQELKRARAGYYPRIDLNLGYGLENSENVTTNLRTGSDLELKRREAGISLNQMLFDGFSTRNETQRQQFRVQAQANRVQETSNTLALRSAEVYLDVFRRQALLELAKDNLVVHQKTLNQIQQRYEQGAGRRADVDQAAAREALASADLLLTQGEIRNTRANYLRVTGELPENLEAVDAQLLQTAMDKDLDSLLGLADEHHPLLQAAQADVKAAQAAYAQTRAAYMPHLDMELAANRNRNLDGIEFKNNDASAMLHLRYNLYRGGADKARRKETAHRIAVAKETLKRAQRMVAEEIRLAWNNQQTITERMEYLKKHVATTEAVVSSYQKQFQLGQRTLLDVLNAKNELYQARTALSSASYAEIFSHFRLLSSSGQLLSALNIESLAEAQ